MEFFRPQILTLGARLPIFKIILYSDEMSMHLQAPRFHNSVCWGAERPETLETNAQTETVMFSGWMGQGLKLPLLVMETRRMTPTGRPSFHNNGDPAFVNVKINSQEYIRLVLEPMKAWLVQRGLMPGGRSNVQIVVQQDGAPSHTSTMTMDWLSTNFGLENVISSTRKKRDHEVMQKWPAMSPG